MSNHSQKQFIQITASQKAVLPFLLKKLNLRYDISHVISGDVKREILIEDYQYAMRQNFKDDTLELNGEVYVGSDIKIVVSWESYGSECFWLEVVEVATAADSKQEYYAAIRNDVLGDAKYGDVIGPIKRRNICKVAAKAA